MTFRWQILFLASFFVAAHVRAGQPELDSIWKPVHDLDGSAAHDAMVSRGYKPLFNGKDLRGWQNPYPHGTARVVDGEIHLLSDKKFFLVTEKQYSDFRLIAEIHLPQGKANSGVMFRCQIDPNTSKKVFGYQAECDGSDRCWSGGLYDEARRGWIWPSTEGRSTEQFLKHATESQQFFSQSLIRDALNRDGWNRFEITCRKDLITIDLNGVQTVRFRDVMDARGFIGIQHHGEKGQTYRFRNLFIKELPEIPASDHATLTEQEPISIQKLPSGSVLLDFGKVAFGNLMMPVPAGNGFAKVHFGEKLKDGRVDRDPPGTVRYGLTAVRLGQQRGNWIVPAPVDTRNVEQAGLIYANPPAALTPASWGTVMPFRWVEIERIGEDFPYEMIRRRAAFSKTWNDDASDFKCSNDVLNRIWDLCKYSIKATTFAGVYVDGDRERIPYEADAYLNQLSHYTTDDNVTMAARTFDWLIENGTWPTEWAPHMVFMAYDEWIYSGDRTWLAQRYESLKSKTLLHRTGDDGLVRSAEQDRDRHDIVDWPKGERDGFVFTEINTVVNAFHIHAIEKMAEMARAVGKEEDAIAFASRANIASLAFQETLFKESEGLYRDGIGTDHSSIHANFFPLAFGLVPNDRIGGVVDWLAKKEMACSPYAAQYFIAALFDFGKDKRALELIQADGDRSWKHMVDSGATISWEAWDLKYKPNQDWNHAWGAAPANLFPRFLLGVNPGEPGWGSATIRPWTGGLTFARGRVPTSRGPIEISWQNESSFSIAIDLPPGMIAKVDIPSPPDAKGVQIDGEQVDATLVNGRWILKEEIKGSVAIKVE